MDAHRVIPEVRCLAMYLLPSPSFCSFPRPNIVTKEFFFLSRTHWLDEKGRFSSLSSQRMSKQSHIIRNHEITHLLPSRALDD